MPVEKKTLYFKVSDFIGLLNFKGHSQNEVGNIGIVKNSIGSIAIILNKWVKYSTVVETHALLRKTQQLIECI